MVERGILFLREREPVEVSGEEDNGYAPGILMPSSIRLFRDCDFRAPDVVSVAEDEA